VNNNVSIFFIGFKKLQHEGNSFISLLGWGFFNILTACCGIYARTENEQGHSSQYTPVA
jgi:hypothetical protein